MSVKIGLLPHYLELYDKACANRRPAVERYVGQIAAALQKAGADVSVGKVCRLKHEFAAQINAFEKTKCDAIVSVFPAYSPSLEAVSALAKTKLPFVILDTTLDYEFSKPEQIMLNHGIHGVQDLCNLLLRSGKNFIIEAGHWQKSDVVDRVINAVKAAKMARVMRKSRVGIIGSPFKSMGDFAVPFDRLKKDFGIETVEFSAAKTGAPSASAVKVEERANSKRFDYGETAPEDRLNAIKAGLAVRHWIEDENLTAFTANFLCCQKLPTVPFLEASKQMAAGVGYAGEGDVLTAALTGAIMSEFPETTFTEMFCPDWKSGVIYLGHMGEVNINLLKDKPRLVKSAFPIEKTNPPVLAAGCLKPGNAVLVNIAPGNPGDYTLIIAPVKVLAPACDKNFKNNVRGWIKPQMDMPDFLEAYSHAGGTHHLAMTYTADIRALINFGKALEVKTLMIS